MYKRLAAVVLAGVVGVGTITAQAQERGPRDGRNGGRDSMRENRGKHGGEKHGGGKRGGGKQMWSQMFGQLGLLNAQKEQIKPLMEKIKELSAGDKEQFKNYFESQKALIEADEFDEEAYRANIREAAQIKEDIAVKQALIKREIHAILTPVQKQKLNELFTEKKEHWEKMKKAKAKKSEGKGKSDKSCPKK